VTVNAYDDFLDLLDGEATLYRALLSLLEKEKNAIIGSNLGELGKTGREKEKLLLKIRIIEEQREIMTKDLAESLGCSLHDLTVTKMAELVEAPYSVRFKRLCSDLLPLAKTIRDVNDGNKALIRHSVELIRGSFAFLNNLVSADAVYHRSGRMRQNDQSGKVLSGSV
jgi:flagellar biosynthesis/type III secretory pathway chaperone